VPCRPSSPAADSSPLSAGWVGAGTHRDQGLNDDLLGPNLVLVVRLSPACARMWWGPGSTRSIVIVRWLVLRRSAAAAGVELLNGLAR
jgi:hypothetical protein